jgi:hypothetical protein
MMHLAHDSLTVVYAMCGLATANSNTRCLMTGSTDLNPHDILLKSHVSGNSIESSIANLVFDFDNALKFQRIDMFTNEIYVYTEFGHPFGYSWFVHEICLDRFNT